jgi:four helix bundle protein
MNNHKDLKVYKDSISLVTQIYFVTNEFPKSEMFGLTNQIRRSVSSIPTNIAEGSARAYKKEFIQFLHISLGSAAELDTQLEIARNLNFLEENNYQQLTSKLNSISKMIQGLIKFQKTKK